MSFLRCLRLKAIIALSGEIHRVTPLIRHFGSSLTITSAIPRTRKVWLVVRATQLQGVG